MTNVDFHAYVVHDLMSNIQGIQSRAMFGGWGLYHNGTIFGIIADDQLYFKADEKNRKEYEAAGSSPFTYEASGRKKVTIASYWEVPADVLENRELLVSWVEDSCKASLRAKSTKKPHRPKKNNL